MIIFGIVIGLLVSTVCWYAAPLAGFINEFDNGDICRDCDERSHCVAVKPTKHGKSCFINDWMLVSYFKVKRVCPCCTVKTNHIRNMGSVICGFFLFFILFWSEGMDSFGMLMGFVAIVLFFLSVVDWNTQYIPFECNIFIFICGLIHLFADFSNWLEYLIGLIAVSGFLFIVDRIGTPVLQKKYPEDEVDSVIGDGDIKLMAATGLLLGWKLNFIALGIGCISGSVIHLIRMKIKGSGAKLALGPYLSLGVYITMICGEQLVSWYLNMLGLYPV